MSKNVPIFQLWPFGYRNPKATASLPEGCRYVRAYLHRELEHIAGFDIVDPVDGVLLPLDGEQPVMVYLGRGRRRYRATLVSWPSEHSMSEGYYEGYIVLKGDLENAREKRAQVLQSIAEAQIRQQADQAWMDLDEADFPNEEAALAEMYRLYGLDHGMTPEEAKVYFEVTVPAELERMFENED